MGDGVRLFQKLRDHLQSATRWVRRNGALGVATAIVSGILIIATGVGATLAVTGVSFFPSTTTQETQVAKSISPTPSPKPLETQSATEGDPYTVDNKISDVGSDPGEAATYQNGTLGVRAYFAPDGVRVAVVFNCVGSQNPALEIWAHEGQLRGDHDLCNGVAGNGVGPRVGVSFFFPACRQLLPTITVITRGTNIDGTTQIPVPESVRQSCQPAGSVTPPISEPLPPPSIPEVPSSPSITPEDPSSPPADSGAPTLEPSTSP